MTNRPGTARNSRRQRDDLGHHISLLGSRLDALEAAAHAAMPDPGRMTRWPPCSDPSGLTGAEQDFIGHWTPRDVLSHSHSQRKLVNLLQFWLFTPRGPDDLDLAHALVRGIHEALPR